MGKQGPCFHCGVASTPLWRNGPPEKPVLCNACGSRWRTKGSLANYTPIHARGGSDDYEEYKVPKVKNSIIKTKEEKLYKKQKFESYVVKGEASDYDQNLQRGIDEDTSNRSSSGSGISYSESCQQFGGVDGTELTGSDQSTVWNNTLVPSKTKTSPNRPKPSSVEKLTKDLHLFLQEQQQSSYLSGSSECELIFETKNPMVSDEIGHGSVLMKHFNSAVQDAESEASSFSVDNKQYTVNEPYSGYTSLPVNIYNKGITSSNVQIDKTMSPFRPGFQQDFTKSENFRKEKLQILQNHRSPLRSVNLKDVITFEEFVKQFTLEEQQLLMKHLPSMDTARLPDSLKSLFHSSQFGENLFSFQQLLSEGVFDLTFSGINTEECRTLKRLALANPTKSKWVEQYNLLKDVKGKKVSGEKRAATGRVVLGSKNFLPAKRARDPNDQNFPDESSDQDLLFDLPPNGSFAQAELLHPSSSFISQATNTSIISPHHNNH